MLGPFHTASANSECERIRSLLQGKLGKEYG